MYYLTADFGSTYTKLTLIDAEKAEVLATSSAFTTIETDIVEGYNTAFASLETKVGQVKYNKLLCCSSAGGGLKMVALGLVPELTSKAAKMAASSAGAKVTKTYAFEISKKEEHEIFEANPDIVLLCGGTDGGNKEVIIANATKLSKIARDFTIIVAGNKSAEDEVAEIFDATGKDYIITENVMPTFNKLNIEPAKKAIRDIFIRKIIDAKGLTGIQNMANNKIMPTPLAVMAGCELLSKGTQKTSGIGEFLAIDLGGATTDVYSMSEGKATREGIITKGLPEPFNKRTVEGDLGMRYSLHLLFEELTGELSENKSEIRIETVIDWVEECMKNPGAIAENGSNESIIEELLAKKAIEIATERHCGFLESSYTPMGEIFSLTGKDLSNVPYIIGIGGAIINSAHPAKILEGAKYDPIRFNYMKPQNPSYMLDSKYIFASMGLLSTIEPELALTIMKKEIKTISSYDA